MKKKLVSLKLEIITIDTVTDRQFSLVPNWYIDWYDTASSAYNDKAGYINTINVNIRNRTWKHTILFNLPSSL